MYDKIRREDILAHSLAGFPLGIKRGEGNGLLMAEPSRRLRAVGLQRCALQKVAPAGAVPPSYLKCLKTATQPVPLTLNAVKQMLSSGAVPAAMAAVICTMVKM